MILCFAPLAFGLTACQTAPAPPSTYSAPSQDQSAEQGGYRAIGTEPFWDLTISDNLVFADRGSNVSVVQKTPAMQAGTAGDVYNSPRIRVNIVRMRCSDGMSERSYPDTVEVTVNKRAYLGCGAPASFFVQVDQRGNPQILSARPGPVTTLERTRWRVARVNGRAVPKKGSYYVDFDSGRIGAKFGCNSIVGPYTQTGTTLDSGALVTTRVACFDTGFETQASAILDQVMTIAVVGRNRIALSSSAGTIDLVRR